VAGRCAAIPEETDECCVLCASAICAVDQFLLALILCDPAIAVARLSELIRVWLELAPDAVNRGGDVAGGG
jgi:hypothetical protein